MKSSWRILGAIAACAALTAVGGCNDDPTATDESVDPAGVWRFGIVVTVATDACDGEVGESSANPITITKSGSTPPYAVTASGFLGEAGNVLTGTFSADNKLSLTGSYPEDGGTTTPMIELVATSADRMEGVENWNWSGPGGTCPGSRSDVTADRID